MGWKLTLSYILQENKGRGARVVVLFSWDALGLPVGDQLVVHLRDSTWSVRGQDETM